MCRLYSKKSEDRPERAPGTRTTTDGRQVRSLHHIDDEDDDLPPRTTTPTDRYDDGDDGESTPTPAPRTPEAPSVVERAPMKDDRKKNKKKK
ncbi:MAG: hypothetical protein IKD28_02570 [Clostridia bacterium]|nr:hypothetical protein [Clostridia bacterium]